MSFTFTDLFCGGGGYSSGITQIEGTAAARTTGPARFYRLPPGEKRDVLAQAVASLYPTEGS